VKRYIPYGLLFLVWVVVFSIIDHSGEFPLIDDWAYAHGVSDYLDKGVLKISDWVAMTQVAHLFMGVGWVAWVGFSLETLREMTLLISVLGSFCLYWLTGFFTRSAALRLVGTLLVTVNPIWLYLSHTFMTDIPFTVLFMLLIGGIVRLMRNERVAPGWAVLILLGSIVLVLIRQTGLGLGLSLILYVMILGGEERRRWLIPAVGLAGAQLLTLIGYETWMASIDALSTRYHGASSLGWILDRPWWPFRVAYYVLIQLHYVGMFLLPLLPVVYCRWRSLNAVNVPRYSYLMAGLVAVGIIVAVGGDILMNPRYTHLMQYDTVGHVMTIDFTYERLEFTRTLYPLWLVIYGLGLFNVFGMAVLALTTVRRAVNPIHWVVLILLGYTLFISIGQFVFDRYLMLSLPLAMLLAIRILDGIPQPPRVYVVSTVFLVWSLMFGSIGTRDSFEWNRVRFGAIQDLEAQGVSPHQIDGGAEYNSWKRTAPLQPLRLNEKSWWYVDEDTYAVAHEEIPGYVRLSAHPFHRYFGLVKDTLYVVRRAD